MSNDSPLKAFLVVLLVLTWGLGSLVYGLFVTNSRALRVFTVAGVALPLLIHRMREGRQWSLWFVALAFGAHVVLDGAVLALRGDDSPVGWVVVAHRLPVGFALVVAARAEHRSLRAPWVLALAMVVATVAGFFVGPSVAEWIPESSTAAMDALVVGVLLHVVLPHGHEGHDESCAHDNDHGHGHHDWSSTGRQSGLHPIDSPRRLHALRVAGRHQSWTCGLSLHDEVGVRRGLGQRW